MLDDPHAAERHDPDADPADNVRGGAAPNRAQVAAVDGDVAMPDFDTAATTAGLDGNLLSAELAQLMQIPVVPEVVPAQGVVADPHALLAVLAGISLSDLMNLSVYSGVGLLQELDALHAQDGAPAPSNPFAAEFLHNMMSLPLPDLMSVGPLQNLFLTDYAHHPGNFDFVWHQDRPEAAGAPPGGGAPPPHHHPEGTPPAARP